MTTDKEDDDCVVFYFAPDPDETDPLMKAHNEEAKREGAEFWNYVKCQGDGGNHVEAEQGLSYEHHEGRQG
jgi:hypothetical protein